MSLHSAFFFLGQALGPIFYRYGIATIGLAKTNAVRRADGGARRNHLRAVSET